MNNQINTKQFILQFCTNKLTQNNLYKVITKVYKIKFKIYYANPKFPHKCGRSNKFRHTLARRHQSLLIISSKNIELREKSPQNLLNHVNLLII